MVLKSPHTSPIIYNRHMLTNRHRTVVIPAIHDPDFPPPSGHNCHEVDAENSTESEKPGSLATIDEGLITHYMRSRQIYFERTVKDSANNARDTIFVGACSENASVIIFGTSVHPRYHQTLKLSTNCTK